MDTVYNFLERFHLSDNIDDVFTSGCCYWFAAIMMMRFDEMNPELMYDPVANHFGTMVGKNVYDITGDVTDKYDWELWKDIDDDLLKSYIVRDCIKF